MEKGASRKWHEMTDPVAKSRSSRIRPLRPVERSRMLKALGLDPRFTYTDHEVQSAWRRRRMQVHPAGRATARVDVAINAAYLTLIDQAGIPRPIDVRL